MKVRGCAGCAAGRDIGGPLPVLEHATRHGHATCQSSRRLAYGHRVPRASRRVPRVSGVGGARANTQRDARRRVRVRSDPHARSSRAIVSASVSGRSRPSVVAERSAAVDAERRRARRASARGPRSRTIARARAPRVRSRSARARRPRVRRTRPRGGTRPLVRRRPIDGSRWSSCMSPPSVGTPVRSSCTPSFLEAPRARQRPVDSVVSGAASLRQVAVPLASRRRR